MNPIKAIIDYQPDDRFIDDLNPEHDRREALQLLQSLQAVFARLALSQDPRVPVDLSPDLLPIVQQLSGIRQDAYLRINDDERDDERIISRKRRKRRQVTDEEADGLQFFDFQEFHHMILSRLPISISVTIGRMNTLSIRQITCAFQSFTPPLDLLLGLSDDGRNLISTAILSEPMQGLDLGRLIGRLNFHSHPNLLIIDLTRSLLVQPAPRRRRGRGRGEDEDEDFATTVEYLQSPIDFPEHFTLRPSSSSSNNPNIAYRLLSIICHVGDGPNHYISYTRTFQAGAGGSVWYLVDDAQVSRVTWEQVRRQKKSVVSWSYYRIDSLPADPSTLETEIPGPLARKAFADINAETDRLSSPSHIPDDRQDDVDDGQNADDDGGEVEVVRPLTRIRKRRRHRQQRPLQRIRRRKASLSHLIPVEQVTRDNDDDDY